MIQERPTKSEFSMSEEQAVMLAALAPLQRKVALNVISGMSNIDSYYAGGGDAKNKASAEATVSVMLRNAKVKEFIDSMTKEAVNQAVMSRQEMLERLSNLARVNMSDLIEWRISEAKDDEGKPIEQTIWSIKESAEQDPSKMASISEVTAGKEGLKIKQHSPLSAMKQLADLEGYNKPQKIEQSGAVASIQMSKEDYAEARKKMLEEDDC